MERVMKIIWQIDGLIVSPQINSFVDVVVAANWRVFAEQNGLRGTSHGQVNFPPPDGDKFTAYTNLTEAVILSWVWEFGKSTDPDTPWSRLIAEQQAIALIELQRADVTERPLPWVPPSPPVEPQPSLQERVKAAETLINLILDEEGV